MPITDRCVFSVLCSTSRCSDHCDTAKPNLLSLQLHGGQHGEISLSCSCYSECTTIWTSARRWRHGARERAKRENHIKARKAMFTFFMSSIKIPNRNKNCPFSLRRSPYHRLGHPFTSSVHQSVIIPLQKRLTSLPMPPKRLINPHNPPKKIPLLIQLLHKSPKPSQHKISITRLLTQNKGPTTILP